MTNNVFNDNAPSTEDAASIICCIIQDTIKLRDAVINAAKQAITKAQCH